MDSRTIDRSALEETLAELEIVAGELDPDPERRAEMWAAVGAHVLRSASTLATGVRLKGDR